MNNADIAISIGLDTDNFKKEIGAVKQSLGGLGDALGGALKVGLFGAAAGIAALGAGLGVAVKSAMEAEEGQAQLAAVLASTGGKAGVTAEAVNALASELQNVTRFEDDAILSGQNLLLTFTNIGKDVFPAATETMLNMSQALGQDLKSSAVQLGKALNDPIQGMTALSRVGVSFTDAQKEQIKALQESGDLMGAQKVILAELEVEFGGAARAAGATFAGKLDILQNKFGDIQEMIGGALIPILTELADGFASLLSDPAIQQAIQDFATLLSTGVKDGIAWLKANLPLLQSNLKQTGETFGVIQKAIAAVWNFIAPILGAIFAELAKFWKEIEPKLAAAWANIQKVTTVVFGAIVQFIQEHSEEIRMIFEGAWKIIQGIFQTAWALISGIVKIALDLLAGDFDAAGRDFKQMMTDIWGGIQLIIEGAWQEIQGYVALALNTLGQAIWDKLTEIAGWFNQQFANIISYLQSLPGQFVQLGYDMIQGIIDGLWQAAGNINSALWEIIQQAIKNALNFGGAPSFTGENFGGARPMLPAGNTSNFGGITINFNGENAPRTTAEAQRSAGLFVDALRAKGYAV